MQTFILTLQEDIFDVYHLVNFPVTVGNMTVANVSHSASMTHIHAYIIHAAKKGFRLISCLENIIVHGEVAFDATHVRIPKRKAFADIHRNICVVHLIMIRQSRISNCNKPVITWLLGCLPNLPPSGTSRPCVIN